MNNIIRNHSSFNLIYKLCMDQKLYQAEVINKHILEAQNDDEWIEIEITEEEANRLNAMSERIEEVAEDIAAELEIDIDEVWYELKLFVAEMKEAN